MTIQQVLSEFDIYERKGFDMYNISSSLDKMCSNYANTKELQYELTAFHLTPSPENNPWDSFYGPMFTGTNETGSVTTYPEFKDITSDAVLYWENRMKESQNPLIIARYAGLVWDFKHIVPNKKINGGYVYRILVDNLLVVCDKDYFPEPIYAIVFLERLFELTIKNDCDFKRTKNVFAAFEQRHSDDHSAGIWSPRFLLMVKNQQCFLPNEITSLVSEHEDRLKRLSTPDCDGNISLWDVENQADILAKYYNSIQNKQDIARVFGVVEDSYYCESKILSPLQMVSNLQNLYYKYLHYGLNEHADNVSKRINNYSNYVKNDFFSHEISFTISPDVIKSADTLFGNMEPSVYKRLCNFVRGFVPDIKREEEILKGLVSKHPFFYLIQTHIFDCNNRPTSYVGSYESDHNGNLIVHVKERLRLESVYIRIAIRKLLESNALTLSNIMNSFILPSPLFNEDRYVIIKNAINSFLEKDFVVFCHLIVPQIENAIRKLAELSDSSILCSQKNGKSLQYKTLDTLLRDTHVVKVLTTDIAFYFRLILTDPRGYNIRNILCHGVAAPEYFGIDESVRLLHVLMILGCYRLK